MRIAISKNSAAIASIIVCVPVLLFVGAFVNALNNKITSAIGLSNYKLAFGVVSYLSIDYCLRKLLRINKARLERVFTFLSNSPPAKIISYLDSHIAFFEAKLSSARKAYIVGIFFPWLAVLIWIMVSTEESLYLLLEPIIGLLVLSLILHFQELRWYRRDESGKIRFTPWRPRLS